MNSSDPTIVKRRQTRKSHLSVVLCEPEFEDSTSWN